MRALACTSVALVLGCQGTSAESIVVRPGQADQEDLKADDTSGSKAEVKVTVAADAIDDTRDDLDLTFAVSEEREVWFYDSTSLDLFRGGAILRARKIVNDDDDSTVKMRPLTEDEVDPAWFAVDGFKCELDWTPSNQVSSCSLKAEVKSGRIKDVADGDRPIEDLFTEDQALFMATYGPELPWYLVPLGPIRANVWEIESTALPEDLDIELWRVFDEEFLELSMKVEVDEIADAFDSLSDWLDDHDIPISDAQETKTRRALELLTGHSTETSNANSPSR